MKVLLVQPTLDPPGGGNLVACWMLEALRGEHALTVLCWQRPDLAACNRFYGTSLRASDFALDVVPAPARALGRLVPLPLRLLKESYLVRRAMGRADGHDVVITANNEADLGRRGIQYVNYPRRDLMLSPNGNAVRAAYFRACRRLARFSRARMATNLTVTSSVWVGRRLRALHGIDTVTLRPPVPGTFPAVPWEAREDGFVAIGRLAPEKHFGRIIDILAMVRAAGRDVRLHIVGSSGSARYARRIRRRVAENAGWVTLHEDLSRDALLALLARQRYGIHAMAREHFGIAVAEMARAGCIAFVPRGGGPAEIVGAEERLLFDSPEEAARQILATLGDRARLDALRAHLAGRAERYSSGRFVAELRAIVRGFATT